VIEVDGLSAWYGEAQALRGVSFRIGEGELITLVGRNGAGKTTALRCLMGLHDRMTGTVRLGGRDISGWTPERRAQAGIGYVPDDRGIYATLTDAGRAVQKEAEPTHRRVLAATLVA